MGKFIKDTKTSKHQKGANMKHVRRTGTECSEVQLFMHLQKQPVTMKYMGINYY